MKRFRFPLHAVLTLRNLHEQRAREAFARALHLQSVAAATLAAAQARVAASARLLCETRTHVFHSGEHAAALLSWRGDCTMEKRAVDTLRQAEEAMHKARTVWLEARRHLQVIENLKARALLRHRQAGEREEQTLLDELASIRAARAMGTTRSMRSSSRDSNIIPSFA